MSFIALFPGQGSQYIGMCKHLLDSSSRAQEAFRIASDVLELDAPALVEKGTLQQLTGSQIAQPLIVAASYSLFHALRDELNTLPQYGIGHSLGELSAYVAANAITLHDGIQFAYERGKLMERALQEQKGHAGLAVEINLERLEELIAMLRHEGELLFISGYNSHRQFIVAGAKGSLRRLDREMDHAEGQFIPFRMMPMKADAPYHSPLMLYAQQEMEMLVEKLVLKKPDFPIISTVTRSVVTSADEIHDVLKGQLMTPVHWIQALEHSTVDSNTMLIDIGPSNIMHNLVMEHSYERNSYAYDDSSSSGKLTV